MKQNQKVSFDTPSATAGNAKIQSALGLGLVPDRVNQSGMNISVNKKQQNRYQLQENNEEELADVDMKQLILNSPENATNPIGNNEFRTEQYNAVENEGANKDQSSRPFDLA